VQHACPYPGTFLVLQMLGAARGMLYLHDSIPPIIHRDLKSPNLLVDAAGRVKVSRVVRLPHGRVENWGLALMLL
jgi:serine/threonine protein kinase